jgi:endonuclease G
MLAILQFVSLLALGLIAIEVSLFAWLNTGKWWLVALATFLTYVGFLSGIFFGDRQVWLPRLFSAGYRAAFKSTASSIATMILCAGLAAAGGGYLITIWPKAELNVTVYASSFPSDVREKDVGVYVRDIDVDAPATVKFTNDRGRAVFAVKSGSKLEMAVRAKHLDRLQFGKLGVIEIQKLPASQPIRLTDIANDAWSPATASLPPRTPVAVVAATAGSIEWASKSLTKSLTLDGLPENLHAPWGLPLAPIVLRRPAYILGFDPQKKVPRWLAYRVQPPDPNYRRSVIIPAQDPKIPAKQQATIADYRGSGYDRGNFISAIDIASLGREAVFATFFMSTVAPQVPIMNRVTWLKLEQYTRKVAGTGAAIYVISGPAFVKNGAPAKEFLAIGESKVAVPTHYFRIIARKSANGVPDVLAFLVPNRADVGRDFKAYRVPVQDIETLTGLRFFGDLAPDKRSRLVSSASGKLWPIPNPLPNSIN